MMKKTMIVRFAQRVILCAISFTAATGIAQRYMKQFPETDKQFIDIDFVDAANGFILASDGIMKTTDGGTTWNFLPFASSAISATMIAMSTPQVGFICHSIGKLYRTTDGGVTWAAVTFAPPLVSGNGTASRLSGIGVVKGSLVNAIVSGYVLASPAFYGQIYYGTVVDTGMTWQKANTTFPQGKFTSSSMGNSRTAVTYGDAVNAGGIYFSLDAGINWAKSDMQPTTLKIRTVKMVDDNIGFAACSTPTGAIAWTTTSGISWVRRDDDAGLPNAKAISFFNAKKGAMLTDNYDIWVTSDSAKTWAKKPFVSSWAQDVEYISDNTIIVVGTSLIARSTDNGDTWQSYYGAYYQGTGSSSYNTLAMNSKGEGIIAGGGMYRTTTAGAEWYNISNPLGNNVKIRDIEFLSDSIAIALGNADTILRSTDAGITWNTIFLNNGSDILTQLDVAPDKGTGVIIGSKGLCAVTKDYGASWQSSRMIDDVPAGTAIRTVTIDPTNPLFICAGGNVGNDTTVVFCSEDGGVTWKRMIDSLPKQGTVYSLDIDDSGSMIALVSASNTMKSYTYDRNEHRWYGVEGLLGFPSLGATVKAFSPRSAIVGNMVEPAGTPIGGVYKSTNVYSAWPGREQLIGDRIVDIYPRGTGDVYFTTNAAIWRRIQGDYQKNISAIDFGVTFAKPTPVPVDKVIPIHNIGKDILDVSDIVIAGGANSPFIPLSSSPLAIAPGATDTIRIRFLPMDAIEYSDTLFILSNAFSQSEDTVLLSGQGISSTIGIATNKNCLDFDSVRADGTSNKRDSIIITSTGNDDLMISSIELLHSSTPPFYVQSGPVPFTLAAGKSKSIYVKFETREPGHKKDTLVIKSNAASNNPDTICLEGVGLGPCLTITNPLFTSATKNRTINFGDIFIGAEGDTVIRFLSACNDTVEMISVRKYDDADDAFTVTAPPDHSFFPPSTTGSIDVKYFASEAKESTAKIVITSNALQEKDTIYLRANGVKESAVNEKRLTDFFLSQNHPNPFSRSTVVGYHLEQKGEFDVRDVLGRIIYHKKVDPATSQLSFDATGFPSGPYFYTLTDGARRVMRMMNVTK